MIKFNINYDQISKQSAEKLNPNQLCKDIFHAIMNNLKPGHKINETLANFQIYQVRRNKKKCSIISRLVFARVSLPSVLFTIVTGEHISKYYG